MTKEATEARRAYRRDWAKKNPDKVRAYTTRYWEKKAAAAEPTEREAEKEPARMPAEAD